MGFYKALARQGMCDYCVCFRRYEVPVTESIVLELQRRLEVHGASDLWTQWLESTARDAVFKAANVQRAGNPRYWLELFQYMDHHAESSSHAVAKLSDDFQRKFKDPNGRLHVAEGIHHHCQVRDRQVDMFAAVSERHFVPMATICVACDFADSAHVMHILLRALENFFWFESIYVHFVRW